MLKKAGVTLLTMFGLNMATFGQKNISQSTALTVNCKDGQTIGMDMSLTTFKLGKDSTINWQTIKTVHINPDGTGEYVKEYIDAKNTACHKQTFAIHTNNPRFKVGSQSMADVCQSHEYSFHTLSPETSELTKGASMLGQYTVKRIDRLNKAFGQ